jgi:hypothetical protein
VDKYGVVAAALLLFGNDLISFSNFPGGRKNNFSIDYRNYSMIQVKLSICITYQEMSNCTVLMDYQEEDFCL